MLHFYATPAHWREAVGVLLHPRSLSAVSSFLSKVEQTYCMHPSNRDASLNLAPETEAHTLQEG